MKFEKSIMYFKYEIWLTGSHALNILFYYPIK